MREIKFRAWDKKTKQMIDSGDLFNLEIYNGDISSGFHLTNEEGSQIEGEFELMQYTGLKDKNKKEVYEGDITICYSKSGEVILKNHVISIPLVYQEIWGNQDDAQIEIIGDIYSNPELLNGSKIS